jgi:hypothetical protein
LRCHMEVRGDVTLAKPSFKAGQSEAVRVNYGGLSVGHPALLGGACGPPPRRLMLSLQK